MSQFKYLIQTGISDKNKKPLNFSNDASSQTTKSTVLHPQWYAKTVEHTTFMVPNSFNVLQKATHPLTEGVQKVQLQEGFAQLRTLTQLEITP